MSGSDMAMLNNQIYQNIDRPYANVDLSKIPSWDIVMSIMEQQALEARRQMARCQNTNNTTTQVLLPKTVNNIEFHSSSPQYNYNYTAARNVEESDASSYCSEEMDSSPAQTSDSDMSLTQSDSDIEIDVDSIEENDDYFVPSLDNIPITVLQLETKLREKELKRSTS
ncbi:hypothetical protein PVAND_010815 [Polypedilum vanderplanki]|uniref:Uncharacterized protein n=1 Tax=Polypedilum vanderplanki TaxID=319348 RepID=A0A9J6CHF0_POLVA|nr:hypothetical protein PVAND_010815 [Polypedilum vanderplanki]